MLNNFRRAYDKTIQSMGAHAGGLAGDTYVGAIESEIDRVVAEIESIGGTDKGLHYIKGDIAEPWHAGTFRICSVARGAEGHTAEAPRNAGPIDVLVQTPTEFLQAQLKYFKSAEDTAKAISAPAYQGMLKVVPVDQIEGVRDAAYQLYLKNLQSRPEQAQNYYDTYQMASARLEGGSVESMPLTEEEALQIAKQIRKGEFHGKEQGLTSLEFIEWSDIVRQSGEAALNAAAITAVLKAAPHIIQTVSELIADGTLNKKELAEAGLAGLKGAGEGALRGGIAAAITISCRSGLLGDSLVSANPTVIAGAVVVSMNAIHNAIGVYRGEMCMAEFTEACLRDTFVVSIGLCGAAIGQSLIPVPLLGALVGNLVGSAIAVVVYEGSKSLFFSYFIESGVSFFCLVKQDYAIPRNILDCCGFDLIDVQKVEPCTVSPDHVVLDTIQVATTGICLLKRGLININTIAYI